MKITRDELHRAICLRLGFLKHKGCGCNPFPFVGFESERPHRGPCCADEGKDLNFSTSEDASARLLDAMRVYHFKSLGQAKLSDDYGDHGWFALKKLFVELLTTRIDRKAAVLLAAQRMLEIEGELSE